MSQSIQHVQTIGTLTKVSIQRSEAGFRIALYLSGMTDGAECRVGAQSDNQPTHQNSPLKPLAHMSGGDMAERHDGQAGVERAAGGKHRAIGHKQVINTVHLMARIDHGVGRAFAHAAAATGMW